MLIASHRHGGRRDRVGGKRQPRGLPPRCGRCPSCGARPGLRVWTLSRRSVQPGGAASRGATGEVPQPSESPSAGGRCLRAGGEKARHALPIPEGSQQNGSRPQSTDWGTSRISWKKVQCRRKEERIPARKSVTSLSHRNGMSAGEMLTSGLGFGSSGHIFLSLDSARTLTGGLSSRQGRQN